MELLEKYFSDQQGFSPLLITNNWQVALINYDECFDIKNVKSIDIHFKTDEVFVLLEGRAVLITAEQKEGSYRFFTEEMEKGKIYNVPVNTWHNIVLLPETKVLIVEDKNSHIGEYKIINLNDDEIKRLHSQLKLLIEEKDA